MTKTNKARVQAIWNARHPWASKEAAQPEAPQAKKKPAQSKKPTKDE